MNYQQWERMTSQKPLGYQDWKKITGVKILSLGMLSLSASGAKYYPAYDETEISMNQEQRRQNNFARMYYKQLRNSDRQKQIDRVTQSSDLSRDIVSEALIHVLDSKYDLLDYKTMEYVRSNFAPEIDMAHSLQRLINGNPMDHDILLLQHEALEAKLMDNPNGKYYGNYGKAHKEANKKYNYQKACVKLRVKGVIPDYESEQEGES